MEKICQIHHAVTDVLSWVTVDFLLKLGFSNLAVYKPTGGLWTLKVIKGTHGLNWVLSRYWYFLGQKTNVIFDFGL